MNCSTLDWNPVSSAQMHSALAGTLAGLVFTGIVLLMTLPGARQHRYALRFFLSGFMVLMFDAFLWGVVGGSQVCAQAWTIAMLAAGLLGLGVLGIFAGLAWLIELRETAAAPGAIRARQNRHNTVLSLVSVYMVALVVGINLWTTARKYVQDLSPLVVAPSWVRSVIDNYLWVMLSLTVLLCVATLVRRFWTRIPPPSERAIAASAYGYLLCVFVSSVLAGQATTITAADWAAPSPGLVALITTTSLIIPAIAVLLQVVALPAGRTEGDDGQLGGEAR